MEFYCLDRASCHHNMPADDLPCVDVSYALLMTCTVPADDLPCVDVNKLYFADDMHCAR